METNPLHHQSLADGEGRFQEAERLLQQAGLAFTEVETCALEACRMCAAPRLTRAA